MNLAAHPGHWCAPLCLTQARGHLLRCIPGLFHGNILLFRKSRSSHKTRIPAGPGSGEQVSILSIVLMGGTQR